MLHECKLLATSTTLPTLPTLPAFHRKGLAVVLSHALNVSENISFAVSDGYAFHAQDRR